VSHASRITAPRGWELVRHAGPLPTHSEDDDLVALADAVREGRDMPTRVPTGFSEPPAGAPGGGAPAGGVLAPPVTRSGYNGRRRGHLRVLPDPAD
jgi:hypothetical protein